MRKLIVAFVLCIISTLCFAQEKIGSYSCSYFDKEQSVEYSDKLQEYYIQITGESKSTLMFFTIKKSKIEKFRQALADTKAKYVEWTKVAKDNNVDKYDKDMNISFPTGGGAWYGTKWWFTFSVTPTPRFLVTDGKYLCLLFSGKKFTASSNEYIDEKAYWVFSSPEEIDELNSLLSEEALNKLQEKKEKTDDLFH